MKFTSEYNTTMSGTDCWDNNVNSMPDVDIERIMKEFVLGLDQVKLRMTFDVYFVLLDHPTMKRWWLKHLLMQNTEVIDGSNRFKLYKKGTKKHWDCVPLSKSFYSSEL